MNTGKFFAGIDKKPYGDGMDVYLGSAVTLGKITYYTVGENGWIVGTVIDEGVTPCKPLFRVPIKDGKEMLQALANILNEYGFRIESDDRELAKQKALAEERLKEIEYLRSLSEKMFSKKELI